ncbi:MAG: S-methyl-5-thioribose-1-phosphate isomerase [Candidatus Omnitrophica bacterium]|nr:S-methyl-5-thioribose-1-phosphate isomerase [Candidatus Omnitrophota bacterium]
MYESPLFWPSHWEDKTLMVLDETLIPSKLKYIPVRKVSDAVDVIKTMKTRAFGQFLVVLNAFILEMNHVSAKSKVTLKHIETVAQLLNASRPTFPFAEVTGIIVGVAQKASASGADVRGPVTKTVDGFLQGIRQRRLERVRQLALSIQGGDNILTHCNVSGELAMACAMAKAQGKKIKVFATETRPYLQGAKLTVWELQEAGIPVTLVADNAVGSLMAEKLVNKVVIGSDRSAANGDIANKVGSYQIAVLAHEFDIPLIALTQPSNKVPAGKDMPIEQRSPLEVLLYERKRLFPSGVEAYYPGFDVVPHQLIKKAITIHAGL